MESQGSTDTTPTTESHLKSSSSVQPVTDEYTKRVCHVLNTLSGQSRFLYSPKASRAERNAGLEGMEGKTVTSWHFKCRKCGKTYSEQRHKSGCQCDEPDPTTWTGISQNHHPTVKPVALLEYLCRLTKTPTGGTVLDPFMGSGTTGIAAHNEGRDFIGIEIDPEYYEIAQRRIEHARGQVRQPELL